MDTYLLLIIAHLLGTILGVGGATLVEVQLNKALADGTFSYDEHILMGSSFTVVRVGLIVSILSGFGFLLLYKFSGQSFRLYNPVLWAKLIIILIIAVNALLLQAHKISLYWGSALSFVSWWAVALLGVFLTNNTRYSFTAIIFTYIVAVVIGAAILHFIRERLKKKSA